MLAVTDSAAKAGLVSFARILPAALFALPAGVAADRWNRRRLMIAADGVRVLAIGGLAAMILLDRSAFWVIALVAFVEGAGAVLFSVAHAGALRAVVPARQLPAAVATQTGRQAAVRLAGPPLGGALFGLARALPFLLDAVSYAFSTLSLLAIRTPFQQPREPDRSPLRSQLAQGVRFLWSRPFLRTCAQLFGLANFIGPGLLLAVVIIGTGQGLSGGEIGVLVAAFGGCLLLGSFASPLMRRLLPVRAVLLLELWTCAQHHLAAHRPARPTRRRRPAHRRVRARHHRPVRRLRPHPGRVGHPEPVPSAPRRASTSSTTAPDPPRSIGGLPLVVAKAA